MALAPFQRFFPELAADECRMVEVFDIPALPHAAYLFTESYCTDPACDCRRVMINVFAVEGGPPLAAISFGFDPDGELPGPFLDPINPQSKYAEDLLAIFEAALIPDPSYVARLERHYQLVKQAVAAKQAVADQRRAKVMERRKQRKKEKRRLKRSRGW